MSLRWLTPPPLSPGDEIAVIAPGSAVPREAVGEGMERLRGWGYRPVASPGLWRRRGDLAGDAQQRAEDLLWALAGERFRAVWCARGGWGAAELLPELGGNLLRRRPRWLIGFSDVTALHVAAWRQRVCSWHAPVLADLARSERFVATDLRRMLSSPAAPKRFAPGARKIVAPGIAAGRLAGGCLSVLAAMAGTAFQPDLRGAVLLLEEIAEAPYRVDRLLWQLVASGMTRGVRAVVLGQFTGCRPVPGRPSRSLRAVLADRLAPLGVPVLGGIPAGHGRRARALPFGSLARVDADRGELLLGFRR